MVGIDEGVLQSEGHRGAVQRCVLHRFLQLQDLPF
jgi:hypothetical protein